PAPSAIRSRSLHDALPILIPRLGRGLNIEAGILHRAADQHMAIASRHHICVIADAHVIQMPRRTPEQEHLSLERAHIGVDQRARDRKSTRLNSSHVKISYA